MKRKLDVVVLAAALMGLCTIGIRPALARPCDITVPTDQPTIQLAIDNASPGDKICVRPGTYTEDLFIGKDDLELAGSGFPTIEGVLKGDTNVDPFPTAVPNIDIQANGVKLYNFTIKSPAIASGTEYASGIVLTGTDIEIFKNQFLVASGNPGSQAIQTWALDNAPVALRDISGLKIYKNRFTSINGGGFGYEAIFINPQSDAVNNGKPVVIEKNTFGGNLYRAIGIQRSNTVVEKNKVATDLTPQANADFGNVPWGIKVFDGFDGIDPVALDKVEIEKNNIGFGPGSGQFHVGIRLESLVTDAMLEKNFVKNPFQDGISVAGDSNDLDKNKVMGAGSTGILVEGDNNTIKSNIVTQSGILDVIDTGASNNFSKNKCKTSSPAIICAP